jgi:predicted nuclease of predicted toxin-antitoxin system
MKILLDQGTPVPSRDHLGGHTVATAHELGWANLQNSQLLEAAEEEGYGLLVTTDQNLKYQQDLRGRKLAVLVLLSTSWPRLQPYVQTISQLIETMQLGDYKEFSLP